MIESRLDERRPVLELLLEGLLARPASVETDDVGTGRSVSASTAGVLVSLPATVDSWPTLLENKRGHRTMALRAIAASHFGSADESEVTNVHGPLVAELYRHIERARLDNALERAYPGVAGDLGSLLERERVGYDGPVVATRDAVAIDAVRRFALRHEGVPKIVMRISAPALEPAASAQTSIRCALAIAQLVETVTVPIPVPPAAELLALPVEPQFDTPADLAPDLDALMSGAWFAALLEDDELPDLDTESATRHTGRGALAPHMPQDVPLPARRTDVLDDQLSDEKPNRHIRAAALAARGLAAPAERIYRYHEWDYTASAYLPEWCTVYERRLTGADFQYLSSVRRKHPAVARQVRRWFGSIRPQAWQRIRRVDDGDELDIDALVELRVDRRAGHIGDERQHIRRDRARRDVAVAFLVDMSASTSTPVVPPPPYDWPDLAELESLGRGGWHPTFDDDPPPAPDPGDTVLDVAKASIAMACDALAQLGDAYAIYGFSGQGRDNVEFHIGKDFADSSDARRWAAVAAMKPLGYTRMGPAIRHAATKLAGQPETAKLLIVVSDGYPQDSDYGPDRSDNDYGLHDTARALREAEERHISTFCITVDPAGHDYLRRMCPHDRYAVIEDIPALPRELARLYRSLSAAVHV